jgi:hypothetical protein
MSGVKSCPATRYTMAELLELERAQDALDGAVETLERIRDHANSGDDPALLAQHELDRIQRKNSA